VALLSIGGKKDEVVLRTSEATYGDIEAQISSPDQPKHREQMVGDGAGAGAAGSILD
jgi:hypothetical protein